MSKPVSFFAELKRRNVLRAGVLYIGAVWALAQGLAQLLPLFGPYDWIVRWFVVAGAIGFPFWLAFAWFYEFTPGGLKRESEIAPDDSIAHATGRKLDKWIIAVLALAVVLLLTNQFVLHRPNEQSTTIPEKSIAVLPFTDLSPGHDQSYFSDGMAEEILNALAQVQDLKVAGRISSFYFRGKEEDLRTIGKALGVANVLEGSVRKQGDKVRITAQLIQASDGFYLWSESYDGDLKDVFALQERIARAITDRLKIALDGEQKAQLVPVATDDTEAYSLYLQARAAYRERGPGVQHSIDLYHAALKRDPKFALAWAGLCGSLNVLPFYLSENEKGRRPQIFLEGEAAGRRAIELAPELATAHIMLGGLYTNAWQWRAAEEQLELAQPLAPSDPEFYFAYTDWLGAMGRTDEALHAAQRAVALDPMAPAYRNLYGYLLLFAGRIDKSIAQLEAGHALTPGIEYIEKNLLESYLRAGRFADAEKQRAFLHDALVARGETAAEIAARLAMVDAAIQIARRPNDYAAIRQRLKDGQLEIAAVFPSHVDDLFSYVTFLIDQHDYGSDGVVILRSALFDDYHHDPRYLRLLEKAGFNQNGVPR